MHRSNASASLTAGASTTRSCPARSRSTSTEPKPGAFEETRARSRPDRRRSPAPTTGIPSSIVTSRRITSSPSAPRVQRRGGLVAGDLGRQLRPRLHVRQVREHRVERPLDPLEQIRPDEAHVEPQSLGVGTRDRQRVVADVRGGDRQVGPLVLQRERDGAAPGADVDDARAARAASGPTSTSSSVSGPRDQHPRVDRERDVAELLARRGCRRPARAPRDGRPAPRTASRAAPSSGELRVEHEPRAPDLERLRQQELGVEPRGLAPRLLQHTGRADERLADRPRRDGRLRQPPAPPAGGASRRPGARR